MLRSTVRRCLHQLDRSLSPSYAGFLIPLSRRPVIASGAIINESRASARSRLTTSSRHWHHHGPLAESSDTIYALSTSTGRSAIAVIRISGPSCIQIYHALCPNRPLPKPRYGCVRTLHDPSKLPAHLDSVLDHNALVLFFPAPRSATGENVLELHIHGGPAIIKAVLQALAHCSSIHGPVRYAEPGEFTRRAFFNDKLDLIQVEALGDVLSAETEQQRTLSMRGTSGQMAMLYDQWCDRLLYARGELEALIDFSEDQNFDDPPAKLAMSVASQVKELQQHVTIHVDNAVRGEMLRDGITVSLLGAPNVGKSSLLNLIVGREAAIVSVDAGTTRDIVEVGLDLGGYFCRFNDMAGLRSNSGTNDGMVNVSLVEQEGIRRAKQRSLESDVLVMVAQPEWSADGNAKLILDTEVVDTASQCARSGVHVVAVINKIDLVQRNHSEDHSAWLVAALQKRMPFIRPDDIFTTSCIHTTHHGLQSFIKGLVGIFKAMTSPVSSEGVLETLPGQDSLGASQRHRLLLQDCLYHLNMFMEQLAPVGTVEGQVDIVVAAEALRSAAECLARINGRGSASDVEAVLGVVFEKFCIGK